MAFPKEFSYGSEDDFVQRMLIPLLHRLGFSVIANYHRSHGEFGKDLVFAEIDRFGHVRYYGLQAKYEASIGLAAVETVVQDCRQAFANPFTHPQTAEQQRIQTFYAVNGGSFSDDARQHFFASVGHPLAACSRLIDGQALLALDRWASMSRAGEVTSSLQGILIEVRFNHRIAAGIRTLFDRFLAGHDNVLPTERLRCEASSNFVARPPLPNDEMIMYVLRYQQCVSQMNLLIDMATAPCGEDERRKRLEKSSKYLIEVEKAGPVIETNVVAMLQTLGPIAAI